MRIISWNVNGIRSAYSKGFVDWLEKSESDIVGLQEIKATTDQLPFDLRLVKGYESYFNSAEKKGYSGTAIYSKLKPNNILFRNNDDILNTQGRFIQMDFENFTIINLYVSNGGMNKERYDEKLEQYNFLISYFKNLLKKQKNIILIGDFNVAREEIDLERPKENTENIMFTKNEREKIEKLLKIGFVDTFRIFQKDGGHYSWWAYFSNAREKNIGWRIDYVFVSENLQKKVKDAFILKNVMGSDHCPVGIDIDIL